MKARLISKAALRFWVAGTFAAVSAGCTLGPDFHRPETDSTSVYYPGQPTPSLPPVATAAQHPGLFLSGAEISVNWWKAFGSESINSLVSEALRANPNVAAAQAAQRQASQLVRAQWGAYLPSVQAGLTATRQKDATGTLSPTLNSGVPVFNLFAGQLVLGYSLDIFGANARLMESLKAQENYQRYQLEATRLNLQSTVVQTAIQLASLRDQLAITERIVALQQEVLDLTQRQYALGAASSADVAAQQALYAQTSAQLPAMRKLLSVQRDAMAILLGQLPAQYQDSNDHLDQIRLPSQLPLSLPSKLVEHRPDVRMAEEQMHAACAQVGVATADMLPQFSLQAAFGGTATALPHMFGAGNRFWSGGANLSQILFDGGELYFRKKAAEAALDESGAQYRASVLVAFQNVADALQSLASDNQAMQAMTAAEDAAKQTFQAATRAEQLGAISHMALLASEQNLEQATLARVQAQTAQYADAVVLYQSLGGGWWQTESASETR